MSAPVHYLSGRVTVVVADITPQHVDAIVNAANGTLLGGGGVDGAIHRAGGSAILEACRRIRETTWPDGLPTGRAVATEGGRLPARLVLHTVGPVYAAVRGEAAALLESCYRSVLELAAERGARTIAIPSISTGAFGYPRDEAAEVASAAIAEHLARDAALREVRLVFFQQADALVFVEHQVFPTSPSPRTSPRTRHRRPPHP